MPKTPAELEKRERQLATEASSAMKHLQTSRFLKDDPNHASRITQHLADLAAIEADMRSEGLGWHADVLRRSVENESVENEMDPAELEKRALQLYHDADNAEIQLDTLEALKDAPDRENQIAQHKASLVAIEAEMRSLKLTKHADIVRRWINNRMPGKQPSRRA